MAEVDSCSDEFEAFETSDPVTDPLYSYEELVMPLRLELVRHARKLCSGNHSRAEDVVQDTLVKAWQNWHRFVPPRGADPARVVRGWLYTIVYNTFVKDFHRAKVRENALNWRRDDLLRATYGNHAATERALCGRHDLEQRDRIVNDTSRCNVKLVQSPVVSHDRVPVGMGDEVTGALATLTREHQDIVSRLYEKGQSYEEIAADLGITPGHVSSRLHRARERLLPMLRLYARTEYRIGCDEEVAPDAVSDSDDAYATG